MPHDDDRSRRATARTLPPRAGPQRASRSTAAGNLVKEAMPRRGASSASPKWLLVERTVGVLIVRDPLIHVGVHRTRLGRTSRGGVFFSALRRTFGREESIHP